MNTSNNSDISYQQSQSWNQRNNKFDLSTEINESPILKVKEELKITETVKIEETSNTPKIEQKITTQESPISKPEIKHDPIHKKENSVYQEKTGFQLWLQNLAQEPKEMSEESKKPKLSQSQIKAQKLIKTELEEIKDLSPASDTLASLLVSQGYYKEAIAMYEKLSIQFPEKKATFAALIGKLKN